MNSDRVAPRATTWVTVFTLALVPVIVVAGSLLAQSRSTSQRERAAIVNLDQGVTLAGTQVSLGKDLAQALTRSPSRTDLEWVELNSAAAAQGLTSGELALSVTIPALFSETATSFRSDPEQADQGVVSIQTPPTVSTSGSGAGRAAAMIAVSDLNRSLTADYIDSVVTSFADARNRYRVLADQSGDVAFAADVMSAGMKDSAAGSRDLATGSGQLAAGLGQIRSATAKLPASARTLAKGTAAYVSGVNELVDASLATQRQLVSGTQELAVGARGLSDGLEAYHDNLKTLGSNKEVLAAAESAALKKAAESVRCPDFNVDPDTQAALCAAFERGRDRGTQLGSSVGVAVGVQASDDALETPQNGVTALTAADALAEAADELHSAVAKTAPTSAATQLATLRKGGKALVKGSHDLASGLPALTKALAKASAGADQLTASIDQLSVGLADAGDRGEEVADGAVALKKSIAGERDRTPAISGEAADRFSRAVAAPVTISDSNATAPAASMNLVAIAVIALWLGALATHLMATRARIWNQSPPHPNLREGLRALQPGLLAMAAQALAVALVVGPALGLPPSSWLGLVATLALVGATFGLVVQAMVLTLGNVGRLASLALGVVGVVSSLLTDPHPTVTLLGAVTPVGSATVAIGGALGSSANLMSSLASLVAWAVLGALVSILAVGAKARRTGPAGET